MQNWIKGALLSMPLLLPMGVHGKYIETQKSVLDPIYLVKTPCFKARLVTRLNVATFYSNDGRDNDLFFVSNNELPSYIGLRLRYTVSADTVIGNDYELGFRVNRSDRVSQIDDSHEADLDIRKLDFFIESKTYGRLSLGQGQTASDRTSRLDLSGTRMIASSNPSKMGGGLFFRTKKGDLEFDSDNPSLRDSYNNINGLRRKTRLRYDTPQWHGLWLAASVVENRQYDASIKYEHADDNLKALAAFSYTHSSTPLATGPETEDWEDCLRRVMSCHRKASYNGSASILFKNGLNFTVAGGYLKPQEQPRHIATYGFGKIGYIADHFCIGETAFTLDFGKYSHFSGNHNIGRVYGAAVAQHVGPWNAYVYAGYRLFSLHARGENFHNINVLATGIFTRI